MFWQIVAGITTVYINTRAHTIISIAYILKCICRALTFGTFSLSSCSSGTLIWALSVSLQVVLAHSFGHFQSRCRLFWHTHLGTLSLAAGCSGTLIWALSVSLQVVLAHLFGHFQSRRPISEKSQKKRPIMKYLPGLSHDTNPLSCSTGNRAKVLLKCHLRIKGYPKYNKVSRLH